MRDQTVAENAQVPPLGQPLSVPVDTATLQLLSQWKQEDTTENPDEVRAAEDEIRDFKRALNESRSQSGEPLLFP